MARLATAAVLCSALAGPAVAGSLYGCDGLSSAGYMASVEGRDGVFFRVAPDLRTLHPMTPETVADLASLTRALAQKGTALIYVPVPTKALAMPGHLSPAAMDFGFNYGLANTVFLDAQERLRQAGVRTVDGRGRMPADGPLPYFRTDPRLTAEGARGMVRAISEAIAGVPGIEALAANRFETVATGRAVVPSQARLIRQQYCDEPLPEAETTTYETTRTYTGDGAQGIIALVGSEHSETPEANFAGFLAEETGLDVIQYSVPGGGAFAAISTYLTSTEFQQARPSILVWELPLAEAPGTYDDQPMQELIAAARDDCALPLKVTRDAERPQEVTVDLTALDPDTDYMLRLDTGNASARRATFAFENDEGRRREREIARHPGQLTTGRFYMPVSELWPGGAQNVTVRLDVAMGDAVEVRACLR